MGWGNYGSNQGKGEKLGYVQEGQVKVFTFSGQPTRVRFLTSDVSAEDIMAAQGVVREQAEELLATKVAQEQWVMPMAYWEHTIREIPGKRFFSTATCYGRNKCPMCAENEAAKQNGIGENKLLPYPIRKRFYVPAWFYEFKMVLFVRAAEDFFDDIAKYVEKNGSACDFEIYKAGQGFETKYKSTFLGPAALRLEEAAAAMKDLPSPRDFSPWIDEVELRRRMEGGKPASQPAQGAATPAAQPADDPGSFELAFGSHKGKTLRDLYGLGEVTYLEFLAKESTGLVKDKVLAFLEHVKKVGAPF